MVGQKSVRKPELFSRLLREHRLLELFRLPLAELLMLLLQATRQTDHRHRSLYRAGPMDQAVLLDRDVHYAAGERPRWVDPATAVGPQSRAGDISKTRRRQIQLSVRRVVHKGSVCQSGKGSADCRPLAFHTRLDFMTSVLIELSQAGCHLLRVERRDGKEAGAAPAIACLTRQRL